MKDNKDKIFNDMAELAEKYIHEMHHQEEKPKEETEEFTQDIAVSIFTQFLLDTNFLSICYELFLERGIERAMTVTKEQMN